MSAQIGGCACSGHAALSARGHKYEKKSGKKHEKKHEVEYHLQPQTCTCQAECKIECCLDCTIVECDEYCAAELTCLKRDAVGTVQADFIFFGNVLAVEGQPLINDLVPLGAGTRADIVRIGNASRLEGGYWLVPSSVVLAPPSLSGAMKVWPMGANESASRVVGLDGQLVNDYIPASRIQIVVNNVNGLGCSYIYDATLVMVDGAGGFAVLRIDYDCNTNCRAPEIGDCHPSFKWGDSRAMRDGQNVYLIGDPIAHAHDIRAQSASGAVSKGLLANHRYVEHSGHAIAEGLLVTSTEVVAVSSGLAIVNGQGELIGMQTASLAGIVPRIPNSSIRSFPALNQQLGVGQVAGPSSFFMRRIIALCIEAEHECDREIERYVSKIVSGRGEFHVYNKSYLGLAYKVADSVSFSTVTDYTSGEAPLGAPRFRLTTGGGFVPLYQNKIGGLQVLGLAGLNPSGLPGVQDGYYFVPGGVPAAVIPPSIFATAVPLPVSPLIGKVAPGDIIVTASPFRQYNGKRAIIALGDLKNQSALSLITYALLPGESIKFCVLRGGSANNASYSGSAGYFNDAQAITVAGTTFPPLMDFDYSNINDWQQLLTVQSPAVLYPSFTAPATQLTNPQVPQLQIAGAGHFHPAV